MGVTQFLQASQKFEIQVFKRPKNIDQLWKSHVPFTGSPQKHPHDADKVIVVVDPYSTNPYYYEFQTQHIATVEELSNLVSRDGEAIPMARIWIRKGSVGLRCTPFVVADLAEHD
jgi:hypothetical protein